MTPNNNFSLPVDDPNQVPDWHESILPGAPRAYLEKSPVIVGGEPVFGTNVPPVTQNDIADYIRRQRFNCFISLAIPIAKSDNPSGIGVVNVHSNHSSLMDISDVDQNELGAILTSYCALLGLILK